MSQLWKLREAKDSIILNVCYTDMSERKTIPDLFVKFRNIRIHKLLLLVLLSVNVYIVFLSVPIFLSMSECYGVYIGEFTQLLDMA